MWFVFLAVVAVLFVAAAVIAELRPSRTRIELDRRWVAGVTHEAMRRQSDGIRNQSSGWSGII